MEGRKEDFERHVSQFFENFSLELVQEKGQKQYEASHARCCKQ